MRRLFLPLQYEQNIFWAHFVPRHAALEGCFLAPCCRLYRSSVILATVTSGEAGNIASIGFLIRPAKKAQLVISNLRQRRQASINKLLRKHLKWNLWRAWLNTFMVRSARPLECGWYTGLKRWFVPILLQLIKLRRAELHSTGRDNSLWNI